MNVSWSEIEAVIGQKLAVDREFKVAIDAIGLVAGHPIIGVIEEDTAVEFVGTRLGDGVDVGAGVALLREVVVAQVDLHRLQVGADPGIFRVALGQRRQQRLQRVRRSTARD